MSVNSRQSEPLDSYELSSMPNWEGARTYLGVFPTAETAVQAIEQLQKDGIRRDQISVASSVPYPHGAFPVDEPKVHLPKISVAGGFLGLVGGVGMIALTSLAYPIKTGHMPIVPAMPTGLLGFEFMMLGVALSTFGGLAIGAGLHKSRERLYDPLISQGHIGVFVLCKLPEHAEVAGTTFRAQGAEKIHSKNGNHL